MFACTSTGVLAQDRPSEAELFGGSPDSGNEGEAGASSGDNAIAGTAPASANQAGTEAASPAAEGTAAASDTISAGAGTPAAPDGSSSESRGTARDELVLGGDSTPMFSEEAAPSDPLSIGGQVYLRLQSSATKGSKVEDYSLNMPTFLDVYFDARPNDRIRGFVRGRMSYDPMLPASATTDFSSGDPLANSGTSGSASLSSLFAQRTNAPRVLLDQLWLSFDVAHTLFVTIGRQHVRWGTARFWTPTDFLHIRRRNPLDVFDARTGSTMLKLHLPIESKSWNFYAYGVTEGQEERPGLTNVAGALRGEFVFGPSEFGLGVFARPDSRAKFAADASAGIGDFDVYAELALVDARYSDRVRFNANAQLPQPPDPLTGQSLQDYFKQAVEALYPVYQNRGYRPQAVAGFTYSNKYNDNDIFTLGAEYFYNGFGYANSDAYPGLTLPRTTALENPATFFYLGQHYVAVFALFPSPFKLDLHSFTLSTLGNLSDRSFISRFDYSYTLLTHLRLDAFFAVHYGHVGEFRFGLTPPAEFGAQVSGIELLPPSLFDVGVALRLAI